MKIGTGRLFFFFALLPTMASAQSYSCPDYIEPEITVTPLFEDFVIDHTKSSQELDVLRAKDQSARQGDIPAGLTTFEIALQGEALNGAQRQPEGDYCSEVVKYTLRMKVQKIVVYVAEELPTNSCGYLAVLEHEQKHVLTARYVLEKVLPVTEHHIREYLHYVGVLREKTPQEAEARIAESFNAYIKSLNASLLELSHKLENDVDSAEEYERLEKTCDGEIVNTLSKARYRRARGLY